MTRLILDVLVNSRLRPNMYMILHSLPTTILQRNVTGTDSVSYHKMHYIQAPLAPEHHTSLLMLIESILPSDLASRISVPDAS